MATDLQLTEEEQAILAGEEGEGRAIAMRILARMAPIYGARSLLPVTRAHIDGCIYEGEAGLEFAERLAALGSKVAVPTSLNVISVDRANWREIGMDAVYADKAARLGQAYVSMGAKPTFTCTPYLTESAPTFGEQIAWSESNAVAYANSVIGARSNRYGDYLDICCALTGRVPASGLHLDVNRKATHHFRLRQVPVALQQRDDFWPVLGYLIGQRAVDGVPLIEGIEVQPTQEQLKAFSAAIATSGSVALYHLAGITSEALDLMDALDKKRPPLTGEIGIADLREIHALLTMSSRDELDLVAIGSPHCTVRECQELASLMQGRSRSERVEMFVSTSRAVREIIERAGILSTLEQFGAIVTADTCIVVAPPLVQSKPKTMMTNSAKYAHYGPGLLGVESIFGSTADCINSAEAGRVIIEPGPWA